MREFGLFLGISLEGIENETMELFQLIESRRVKGISGSGTKSVESKRLKNESKKLESSVNYDKRGGRLCEGGERCGKGTLYCAYGF